MGGDCLKYLKRGWNKKEGRGNKDFEKVGGGKLGQGVGALKGGGVKPPPPPPPRPPRTNPLTNYVYIYLVGKLQISS